MRVIAVSSSKGGVGKSTLSAHLSIYLLKKEKRVCVLDCDSDQGTLSRYLENRKRSGLAAPSCVDGRQDLTARLQEVAPYHDVAILDTPGGKSPLVAEAHSLADKILSVFNDSFADLDVLARIENPTRLNVLSPRDYSAQLWEERRDRIQKTGKAQEWFLVLNRVGQVTKNRKFVLDLVEHVSKQWGVKFGGMLKERVGYRDGFLLGKTAMDSQPGGITASHIAARQELRHLASLLGF